MKTILAILSLTIAVALSGCATISREEIRMNSGYEKWYYPATREEFRAIVAPTDQLFFEGWVEKPLATLAILDLPFSMLFDTLLWPIDFVDGNYGRPQVRPKFKNKLESHQ